MAIKPVDLQCRFCGKKVGVTVVEIQKKVKKEKISHQVARQGMLEHAWTMLREHAKSAHGDEWSEMSRAINRELQLKYPGGGYNG